MAVGEDGAVLSSQNGTNWNALASGTIEHLNHVSYSLGRFWIAGNNGLLLTNQTGGGFRTVPLGLTNALYSISTSPTEVLVTGDSALVLSDPGFSQPVLQTNNVPSWPFYTSLWDGRLFLVGGKGGMVLEGFRTNATAPLHWYSQSESPRSWLWSVTRANGFYVATGASGTILTSVDGVNWEMESTPTATQGEILMGVAANPEVIVAAGTSGKILYSPNELVTLVSTNAQGESITNVVSLYGLDWREANPGLTTQNLQGVAERDGTFVVAGASGTILTSANGSTWVQRLSGTLNTLSAVAAHAGGFVAAGDRGTLLSSSDGVFWRTEYSGVTNWIYGVKFVNNRFIAVGEAGLILESADGKRWDVRNSGTSTWLNSVAYTNGKYFVSGDEGVLLSSSDAVTWVAEPPITVRSLYSLATHESQVIAVGTEGTILRKRLAPFNSPVQILDLAHQAEITTFLFLGKPGQRFQIEGTLNLPGGWVGGAEAEIRRADGTLIYLQRDSSPRRYFRTVAEP
jgi:hypothetical protein